MLCFYAKCNYAECHILLTVTLNNIISHYPFIYVKVVLHLICVCAIPFIKVPRSKMGATTLSISCLYVTFSISDSQHKWHSLQQCSALMQSVIMLSVTFYLLWRWMSLWWMLLCWVSYLSLKYLVFFFIRPSRNWLPCSCVSSPDLVQLQHPGPNVIKLFMAVRYKFLW
jgi:hypothetical protein